MFMYLDSEYKFSKNGSHYRVRLNKMKFTNSKGIYTWNYNVDVWKKVGREYKQFKGDFWYEDKSEAEAKVNEILSTDDIDPLFTDGFITGIKFKDLIGR